MCAKPVSIAMSILFVMMSLNAGAATLTPPPQTQDGGAGSQASEMRTVSAATERIIISGPMDLVIRPSPTAQLIVKGDPRLVSRVTTVQDGKTLLISTRGMFVSVSKQAAVTMELSVPKISMLQTDGSGDISLRGFRQTVVELFQNGNGNIVAEGSFQEIHASLQGSGNIHLKGQAVQLQLRTQGSGDLSAAELITDNAVLICHGSGNTSVSVKDHLTIQLSGSGNVSVSGNPVNKKIDKKGSGQIIWKNNLPAR